MIVVLGSAQYNGRPSAILAARLDHAAALYKAGVAPRIITVGGRAQGDRYSEAGAGQMYLEKYGVPASAILPVEQGTDTLNSLTAAAKVFNSRGWHSAVLVTDPWHELRARQMFRDLGIKTASSPTRSGPAVHDSDDRGPLHRPGDRGLPLLPALRRRHAAEEPSGGGVTAATPATRLYDVERRVAGAAEGDRGAAQPVRAGPGARAALQRAAPARREDAGGRRRGRRLPAHPADAHARGRADRPRARGGRSAPTRTWSTPPAWPTTSGTRRSATTASGARRRGRPCGGFEGNAQSFRELVRLESKVAGAGLNLTRAGLDAVSKYPWPRGRAAGATTTKYGVYADDLEVFRWMRERGARRAAAASRRRSWTGRTTSRTRCTTSRTASTPGFVDLAVLDDPEEADSAGRARRPALRRRVRRGARGAAGAAVVGAGRASRTARVR